MGTAINSPYNGNIETSIINQEIDTEYELQLKLFTQFYLIIMFYGLKVGQIIDESKLIDLKSIEENCHLLPNDKEINFWIANFSERFCSIWESGIRDKETIIKHLYK